MAGAVHTALADAAGRHHARDRFRPLAAQARRHGTHTDAFDLAEQIDAGAP